MFCTVITFIFVALFTGIDGSPSLNLLLTKDDIQNGISVEIIGHSNTKIRVGPPPVENQEETSTLNYITESTDEPSFGIRESLKMSRPIPEFRDYGLNGRSVPKNVPLARISATRSIFNFPDSDSSSDSSDSSDEY